MPGPGKQAYLERARAMLAARRAWQTIFEPNDYAAAPGCDQSDQSDQSLLPAPDRNDPDVSWRVAAMRTQIQARGPVPFLVARGDLVDVPGRCLSCGDPLGPGRRYRCGPCVQAAELVVNEAWEGHHRDDDQNYRGG